MPFFYGFDKANFMRYEKIQVVVKPGIVLKPKRADRRFKTTPEFLLDNLRFHADAIIRSVIKQKRRK